MIQIRINEDADISVNESGVDIRIEKASISLGIDILRQIVAEWESVNPDIKLSDYDEEAP